MNSQSAKRKFSTRQTKTAERLEPMEIAYVDVPDDFTGAVIQKLSQRKGELTEYGTDQRWLHPYSSSRIPSRGLIGYRGEFYDRYQGKWYHQHHLRRL